MIANTLGEEIDIVYLCGVDSPPAPEGFKTVHTENNSQFLKALASIKPDLLLRDSGSTIHEEVEKVTELVPSIIHFDDFGDGGKCADLVFQTLYVESNDSVPDHYVLGRESFIADEQMDPFKHIGLRKTQLGPLPHLVISFGEEDEGNLTYRALRHIMQLQIPLKVTILIGEEYTHDTSTIRMMALERRNTTVLVPPYNYAEIYAAADIILMRFWLYAL